MSVRLHLDVYVAGLCKSQSQSREAVTRRPTLVHAAHRLARLRGRFLRPSAVKHDLLKIRELVPFRAVQKEEPRRVRDLRRIAVETPPVEIEGGQEQDDCDDQGEDSDVLLLDHAGRDEEAERPKEDSRTPSERQDELIRLRISGDQTIYHR